MTDEEKARLREQLELSIWLAIPHPPRSFRSAMLASASRCVVHHHAEQALHGLAILTVLLRSGLQLDVSQDRLQRLVG